MNDTQTRSRTTAGRTVGAAVVAGAVGGLVVGIAGRIAMAVLASVNEEDAGIVTDDGFPIGRFTIGGTLSLVALTVVVGLVGGLIVLALRGLRFGPAWFRFISMPVGATVVAGSLLVHEGTDYTVLKPTWLAVTLILLLPLLYAFVVVALVDRWVGDESTFWTRLPVAVAWIARVGLAVLVAVSLGDLVSTIDEIANPFQFD
jgi:hypothetical protein